MAASPSIPASAIVNVIPNVIGAGGTGLDLIGLFLTGNTRVPIGSVMEFATTDSVASFFGGSSKEASLADDYFAGFDNSNIKPAGLLFYQFNDVPVKAYLRGGSVAALTLAQIQAISGTLTISVHGTPVTSSTINLSAATSFSNAAALIQTGLGAANAVVTGAIAGSTLTVSAVASGELAIGQTISGTGITPGTTITALGTGTGGTGTYTVSVSQTVSSTAITAGAVTVVYDSTSGGFVITDGTPGADSTLSFASGAVATALLLTEDTGATLSQGADAQVAATVMDTVVSQTQNFVSFATALEVETDDKLAFAQWSNGKNNRYLYVMQDSNGAAATASPVSAAGYQIAQLGYSGTMAFYEPVDTNLAAFVMGAIASLDFDQVEGRATLAFRSQAGRAAGVTDETIANQLIANGYNFYGAYGTANDRFVFLYPGSVSGDFLWADSYVNQVWMNNGFQLALMTLLTSMKSIPYNIAGYALIEAACMDVVNQALDFGAIRPGITLSELQAAQVNAAAGVRISDTLSERGWYLQVRDALPATRAARGSPPCTFWYTDGGSVQRINLVSVEVQ